MSGQDRVAKIPGETPGMTAEISYDSNQGTRVTKRGEVIYLSRGVNEDKLIVHLLTDDDRVVAASDRKTEVRSVGVEDAVVEGMCEPPGPDGYDVLAVQHYGRKIGENPEITIQD